MANLIFQDEFTTLDFTTWATTFRFRDPEGNGGSLPPNYELQWYINHAYEQTDSANPWSVADGKLTLTASVTPAAVRPYLGYTAQEQADNPAYDLPGMGEYDYISGLLVSRANLGYGYFEISAKLPAGQGLWPAFWLLPTDMDPPGEIDIFEVLGHEPNQLWTTIHTETQSQNPHAKTQVVDMSQGFNTYAVDWNHSTITFYFNNQQVFSYPTPSDLQNKTMYMLVNLAVGGQGSWPGPIDPNEIPAEMQVEYIRVWDANPYSSPGGGQTLTGSDATTPYNTLTGGAGNDLLIASHRPDVLTGAGGADTFRFNESPWQPGQITDFQPGVDKIDLTGLFAQAGVTYSSGDPVAQQYVLLTQVGSGVEIKFEPDGAPSAAPWGSNVTTVQNATVAQVQAALLMPGSSGGGGQGENWVDTGGVRIHHTGTPYDDVMQPGPWGDTLTGLAGDDRYVFAETPWNNNVITDFTPGEDVLDLRPIFQSYGGSNPVADGKLIIQNDGAGNTTVSYDADGPGGDWPSTVAILEDVTAGSLVAGRDWIFQ